LGAVGKEIISTENQQQREVATSGTGVETTTVAFPGCGWHDFTRDNVLFLLMEGAPQPVATVHVLGKVHGRFVLVS
jgi:hypothetical protein